MKTRHRLLLALPALAVALTACGGADASDEGAAAPPRTATSSSEARALFDSLCFTCHGKTGHGDGPGAAALEPKPRSFADVTWQDSVTDEHIQKTIVYGGAAVQKSPMMPAQPQLKGKDEVLASLVAIVRGFRGK
jgi:hypothetical protein